MICLCHRFRAIFSAFLLSIRKNGGTGTITCRYKTEDGSATAGHDYEAAEGMITMQPQQLEAVITVEIKGQGLYEHEEDFRIILHEPKGGATFDGETDGGDEEEVLTKKTT